jgi:hypothetical protein
MLGHNRLVRPVIDDRLLGDLPRRIVDELIARNWDVPGVTVRFHYTGTGEAKVVAVRSIATRHARLDFTVGGHIIRVVGGRRQLDVWWDTEGFSSIHVHDYTGTDWAADADTFMEDDFKSNRYPSEIPRNYASYRGACNCTNLQGAIFTGIGPLVKIVLGDPHPFAGVTHEHRDTVPPLMTLEGPQGTKVQYYLTSDVLKERRRWLEHLMLAPIRGYLLPDEVHEVLTEEPVPFPSGLGPFYAFATAGEVSRWTAGHADPSSLAPERRYGLSNLHDHGFSRLYRDEDLPEPLWHGATVCGFGRVSPGASTASMVTPAHLQKDWYTHLLQVDPQYANNIYVGDWSVYGDFTAADYPDNHAYAEALYEADRRVAATIVPVTEYRGDYYLPMLLVARELSLSEIVGIGGELPKSQPAARPRPRRRLLRWPGVAA